MSLRTGRTRFGLHAIIQTASVLSFLALAITDQSVAGEFRSTVGERTIVRASAFEPVPEESSSSGIEAPRQMDVGSCGCASCRSGSRVVRGCQVDNCGQGDCCGDAWFADQDATNFWVRADYLLWWRKGQSVPALVTTSGLSSAITDAGVMGEPTTSILLGQEDIGVQGRPGGRLVFGTWCDPCRVCSFEVDAFFLGKGKSHFAVSDADMPIIARPFLNVTDSQPIQQDSLVIAYPGIRSGSISVDSTSEVLGGDLHFRTLVCDYGRRRLDFQFGYQFSRIDESLTISSQTDANDLAANLLVRDEFSTRNEFHGGSLGLLYTIDSCQWTWRLLAKVGLGNMHQSAQLSGQQTIDDGVSPVVSSTGLLVQSTNRGIFAQDKFSAVPELGISGIYHLTPCVDLSVGYTYLLWNNVLQPSGTIDPNLAVNLSSTPVTQRPTNPMNDGSYSVHGLNLGVQWRF